MPHFEPGDIVSPESHVVPPDLSGAPQDGGRSGRGERRRMSAERVASLKRRRRRRRIMLAIVAVLAALAACGAFLAYSALVAKREISAAVSAVSGMSSTLLSGDSAAATSALDELSEHIGKAYEQTSNPLWTLAELVPYYGADVSAARDAVCIMEHVANDALPQLAVAVGKLDVSGFGVHDGTISLPGLRESSDHLKTANEVITEANVDLQQLGGTHIGVLTDALSSAQTQFADLAGLVDAVSRFARIAPDMLDLDGGSAKTYLVIGENNAELRASGGLPGSWGTLTVDHGVVTVSDFVAETAIPQQQTPVTELSADELTLFGDKLGTIAHDVNITPDFSRTGAIAQAFWAEEYGQRVDGVLAVDPVLLQSLLRVTGSVTLDDGTVLDGSNTARMLLHDEYYRTDDYAEQDAFFADAAGKALRHAMNVGDIDVTQLAQVFADAASQGHLKLWLADESAQRLVENTAIGGTLGTASGKPSVGVYLNNASQSKLDWYLDRSVDTEYVGTLDGGERDYDVRITLTNTLEQADVAATPSYVLGDGIDGLEAGQNATIVYIVAPAGGRLVSWTLGDNEEFDNIATLDGLTVGVKRVVLNPGESIDMTVRVRTSSLAAQNPGAGLEVRQTPQIGGEAS